jgi:cytochrome P450
VFARLLSPEGLADPYPIYRELREREAAGRDIGRLIVRWDQATAALSDRTLSSDRVEAICRPYPEALRAELEPVAATLRDIVAFRDPPGHTRVRTLLRQAFTPSVLRRQRELVERTARDLLDRFVGGRSAGDFHADISFRLPALVIAGMLGIPDADRPRFERWALDTVFFVGSGAPTEAKARSMIASMAAMRELFADLLPRRRAEPGDDLLTALIDAADDDGERLAVAELEANALFLMVAGHETAANMLTNGLLTLLRHPEQRAHWAANLGDDVMAATAPEELLRFESAVQMTPRLATMPTELFGRHLREGQPLIVLLGAANRDPERFPDPDTVDLTRADNRHLAFSHGAHWCLGGNLARQELGVVMPLVLERLPRLALATEVIEWQATLDFRGPLALPVRW